MKKAAVLVAGSWGTALATVLVDNGYQVALWSRILEQVQEINELHSNSRFLKAAKLPAQIVATIAIEQAIEGADLVLFVAPSAALRAVAIQAAPYITDDMTIVHATKGFEADSMKRMSTVLAEELASSTKAEHIVVLSGPSHAEEVVERQPTTVVVASRDLSAAERAQDAFMTPHFRVYTNDDVVGVEVAGAIKNIIALAAGIMDGLGYGDNMKAALLTRGLAEISRLGVAMGGNPQTFAGLAGVGDLIVTGTSKHSRNWRAGSMLAQGLSLEVVLEKMGMVVEGVKSTRAAFELAKKYQVDMPITAELYTVLFEGKTPGDAVRDLMARERKVER